jgi:hypothetical protein
MNRLFSTVTWFFVAISTPTIALSATNYHDDKNINYDGFFTMNPNLISQDSFVKEIAEKTIIKNSEPSHGSFQEVSEVQSKWSNPLKPFQVEERRVDLKRVVGHWDVSLLDQQHHGDNSIFHVQVVNGHNWEHEIEHGKHEMEDGHMAQPVPEPGTYLMMVLGVLSLIMLRRRQ